MTRGLSLLVLALAASAAAPALAQPTALTSAERERCITSMARVEVDTPHGIVSGSGTLIDPRGYVLTNFHVVGHRNHLTGTPGVLRAQRFRVALVRNERDIVQDDYEAEVVRGDVRLDLALLRIVRRTDRAELGATPFPSMPVRTDLPSLSTPVWALGFPSGMRTINVTAGQVAGFENDNSGEANWMRTDTEFNPGNSGGALIDASCRLVGVPTALAEAVEPIELARPSTRIPAGWLRALASGAPLTLAPMEGFREIAVLSEIEDSATGEDFSQRHELRYYRLPSARPGVASVSPRLVIAIMGAGGHLVRESEGEILVTASDSPSTLIAVVVPRGRDGRTPAVRLRYTPLQDGDAVAGVASRGAAPLRGQVTRTQGSGCATYVALVAPQTDVRALVDRLRRGEVTDREVRAQLLSLSVLASDDSFTLEGPVGPAMLVFLGPSGVEHLQPVELLAEGVDVGAIELTGRCR